MKNMKRFFAEIKAQQATISGDENSHLRNVLRMQKGDAIIAFNGDGNDYECELFEIGKQQSVAKVKAVKKCKALPKKSLSLFMAAVKREKLEQIIQKAVELGCQKLVIFEAERSNMKVKEEKLSRYEKIVLSACKQCERSDIMSLKFATFSEMLTEFSRCKLKLFANEREGEKFEFSSLEKADNIGVLIGCEGGFSQEEKDRILALDVCNISLGSRILRAETAAILLVGLASLLSGN